MQRKHLINLTIFNDKNLQQTRNILLLFSCSVLSDPLDLMYCSMPGSPVLHYLLEFAQIHVH